MTPWVRGQTLGEYAAQSLGENADSLTLDTIYLSVPTLALRLMLQPPT